jgi:ferredoxin-NADP reductase
MKTIDYFLDRITMYRLTLYYLIGILITAIILSAFGVLSYNPFAIIFSSLLVLGVALLSNFLFAWAFDAPINLESPYITALILASIITPLRGASDLPLLIWAPILAMASKYILAIGKKHIFNPAAIAVVITAFALNQSASWWIGTAWIAPVVLIGGLLLVRKTRREDLVFSFAVVSIVITGIYLVTQHDNIPAGLLFYVIESSFLFFAFVMLTEPLTTPPNTRLQIIYGALVGILFAPQIHLGSIYSTPELALVVGNIFSYLVSPKGKFMLRLKETVQLSPDMMDFVFTPDGKMKYLPGQYMEWTLPHAQPDARGTRRYFTLASSPTEDTLRLGVRFSEKGSSYKALLKQLDGNTPVLAGQLSGDFVMPSDSKRPLAFIAGGIGVTPYRSMIKYLIDTNQPRAITLLYSARTVASFVYTDVFSQAETTIGLKTEYVVSDEQPFNWTGHLGMIDATLIQQTVPDYLNTLFYISGPQPMVQGMKNTLRGLGVKNENIKTDFFPGLT